MSHFTSSAKQYAAANSLIGFGSIDVNVATTGTTLSQTAPPFLLGPDNVQLGFLFWDTGRRITNKRTVHWTFNHPESWTTWRAIAWYGTGGGKLQPVIATGAYSVGSSPLAPSPIDGPGSSFVNGPGGTLLAWPWSGNEHELRTEWGAATVHAKGTMQIGIGDPQLEFSSWAELIFGGDDTDFFDENDNDVKSTSAGSGVSGLAASGSPNFAAAKGYGANLIAAYVSPTSGKRPGWLDRLRETIAEGMFDRYIDKGDPSPEDIIRLKLISESIDIVRGERPTSTDAFEALTAAAKDMSAQELKRTIVSTQTTLRRGQAAVKYLESLAAKAQLAPPRSSRTKAVDKAKAPAKSKKPVK